jgi:uncharacterized protein DUF5615
MRILLDESLPQRLRRSFAGHEVVTVVEAGWSGVENGELLRLAATRFDVFVTADQNFAIPAELERFTANGRSAGRSEQQAAIAACARCGACFQD